MDSAAIDATGTDLIADALERYFGFREFRRGQREVVEAIVEGRPTLAVMPTGAGKSLCYQLPAMLLDGVTVVVSPLIALMKDQVDALRERGIAAAYINSTVPLPEQRQALDDAASGRLKLLYLTPERFRFGGAMAAIKRLPIALFAVDEAHCISSWGHDFRPDYMNLGNVVRELDVPRVAAFTATATAKVRIDIVDSLGFVDPTVKVAGFLRDNLHLAVTPIRKMKEKQVYLRQILDQATGPAIVYCATRKNCEEVAHYVKAAGRPVATYHGGMADAARSDAQDRFQSVENICIVATNAFGMGVDKANVRVVVHWDIPGSLDAYYQEAGRAGRDGKPAHCFLLFTYADTRIHEFFIDKGGEALAPDSRVAYAEMERSKLKAMVRYAYADECRHGAILRYFGDRPERCGSGTGATCDNCNGDVGEIGLDAPKAGSLKPSIRDVRVEPRILTEDEEIIVQKVLSAVARSNGRLKKREICRVLRGSKTTGGMQTPISGSKSYGILGSMKEATLIAVLEGLGRAGCTNGTWPVLTDNGREAMWRRTTLMMDVPPFQEKSGRAKAKSWAPRVELDPDGEDLVRRLKQRRIETANERGVPAFVVASNRLLEQIAVVQPGSDVETWLEIKGIGEGNVGMLRDAFMPVLQGGSD